MTGEFDATSRRSIVTVSAVTPTNFPLPSNVIKPVPTVVLTPEEGWLSGELANHRYLVTPFTVDSRAVVKRTVSGMPKLSYTIISDEVPAPFASCVVEKFNGIVVVVPLDVVNLNAFWLMWTALLTPSFDSKCNRLSPVSEPPGLPVSGFDGGQEYSRAIQFCLPPAVQFGQ